MTAETVEELEQDCATYDIVTACETFARQYGVDAMLDKIADIHMQYAPSAKDEAIKLVYDMIGIDLARTH